MWVENPGNLEAARYAAVRLCVDALGYSIIILSWCSLERGGMPFCNTCYIAAILCSDSLVSKEYSCEQQQRCEILVAYQVMYSGLEFSLQVHKSTSVSGEREIYLYFRVSTN